MSSRTIQISPVIFLQPHFYGHAEPSISRQNLCYTNTILSNSNEREETIVRFFEQSLHNDARRAWITSVEVDIDKYDMTLADREATLDEQLQLYRQKLLFPDSQTMQPVLWHGFDVYLHRAYISCLKSTVWPRKVKLITGHLRLQVLVLHIDYIVCLEECCDLSEQALVELGKVLVKNLPKTVKVFHENDDDAQAAKDLMAAWDSTQRTCKAMEGGENNSLNRLNRELDDDQTT